MAEVVAFRHNCTPYPLYAQPWAVVFPLLDADGDPTTPSSPDSEVSLNGNTFADCTNEAVEIATSSGVCYLILTAAEMTADIVTVQIKSTGAKTTILTLYPRKLVSIRANTSASLGSLTSTIVLDASASAVDDFYNGMICVAVIDTLTEVRMISDYTGSSKVANVVPDWNVAPDNNDTFTLYLPDGVQIQQANASHWNSLATVALPLVPATAGRSLVVDAAGLADANTVKVGPTGSGTAQTARDIGASVLLSSGTGTGQLKLASGYVAITWADVAAPTTTLALTGTTIAVTQKVDVDTIKTNPVVNAGTITFPTTATLASTTNITAGTIATVTNLTNAPTNGDLTATMKTSVTTAATAATPTIAATQAFNNTGTWTGNIVGTVSTLTTYTGNTLQTGDAYAKVNDGTIGLAAIKGYVDDIGVAGVGLTAIPTIARVTLVDTVTTNTDMRGTDNAMLASSYTAPANSNIAAIKAKTDNLPVDPADASDIATAFVALAATPLTLTSAYDAAKTAAQAGNAMTLTSGERTAIATALLKLDLSTITGEASRSLINAIRKLRNKWSISGTTLTVYAEDDVTAAYTQTLTATAGAAPITGIS